MKKIFYFVLSVFVSGNLNAQDKNVLTAPEFEKVIKDGNVILIDVRRPEEFKEGHIKGALNANWQNLEAFKAKTARLDKTKPVYVYCLAGVRSQRAADYLLKNGFKQVIGLDGGIEAWSEARKPLVKP
ncbi:MAG: rhodanese-like domain-containing protein [Chitinophagaceae bacterium]|nr:MAG: rhodanese-like domain-containing protein [Chitinophagaceae bacterium]